MSPALALLARDLRLARRAPQDALTIVVFFVLAAILFPFGIGPEPALLARVAAGVIWVTALLATLLGLERLFRADHEDGSLDLVVLSPAPLELLVLAKCAAHWLVTGLPLIVVSPLLAAMLNLPAAALPTLLVSLALGTPALSLVGAIGAALTLGARRGGALLPLLVLPLFIPILIFAVAAVEAGASGLAARPHLLLLGALLAFSLPVAAFAASAALRQSAQ